MSWPELKFKSSVSNTSWLGISQPAGNAIATLLLQLEHTQWLPTEKIQQQQVVQFNTLLAYVTKHSPYYCKYPTRINKLSELQQIPLLTRQNLSQELDRINCREIPQDHLPAKILQTSGSTGEIVSVNRTALSNTFWAALTMRDHLWHNIDFSKSFASIRAGVSPQASVAVAHKEGWGSPATLLFETGPMFLQPLSLAVKEQAAWLLKRNPSYLLTYPTNLAALLDVFEEMKEFPAALELVKGVGETFSQALRDRCHNRGLKTIDVYSSQEVGTIALQCPTTQQYHIQAESLIVEILDERGDPCKPGQVGQVVITDLHNFATPLIRYEIRDYARAGEPCSCGRGLPVITEILGRKRNMVVLPDGSRHWPTVGFHKFKQIAPIKQYQLLQHDPHSIEVRLVVDKLSEEQEAALRNVIQTALGYPFSLRFIYYDAEFPKTKGGKFEDFISYCSM